jgi:hypothetical protein
MRWAVGNRLGSEKGLPNGNSPRQALTVPGTDCRGSEPAHYSSHGVCFAQRWCAHLRTAAFTGNGR